MWLFFVHEEAQNKGGHRLDFIGYSPDTLQLEALE